jgi:hypothetical protein
VIFGVPVAQALTSVAIVILGSRNPACFGATQHGLRLMLIGHCCPLLGRHRPDAVRYSMHKMAKLR